MGVNLNLTGNLQAPYVTTDGTNLVAIPALGGTMALTSQIPANIKAWANIDGTTLTVVSSYNISSVVYGGTGIYQIYYTSSLANANYSVVSGIGNVVSGGNSLPNIYSVTKYTDRIVMQVLAINSTFNGIANVANNLVSLLVLNS